MRCEASPAAAPAVPVGGLPAAAVPFAKDVPGPPGGREPAGEPRARLCPALPAPPGPSEAARPGPGVGGLVPGGPQRGEACLCSGPKEAPAGKAAGAQRSPRHQPTRTQRERKKTGG